LIVGCAVALIVVIMGFLFWDSRPEEPVYEGRLLREWISDLANDVSLSEQSRRAEDAIQNIGTNALPVILDELRIADDSKLVSAAYDKYKYSPLARKGSPIRLSYREPPIRRMQASHALRVLAEPLGLPILTNLLNDVNPQVQQASAEALVSGFTIEGVAVLMEALGSKSVAVRLAALHGLPEAGYIPQKIDTLIVCLTDSDPQVRKGAASCLLQFSPVYRDLKIPGLIEALELAARDVDPSVRTAAQQALAGIRPVLASESDIHK